LDFLSRLLSISGVSLLAEELRGIRSEVKVLFMSAYSIETVEDYLILLPGSRSWSSRSPSPSLSARSAPHSSIAHRFHGHASVEMNRVPIDLVPRSTR
jgi:hypothetical protein